jgi:hypothetical protein
VYRQVTSLIGLQLVTSFISVAKTLSGQRETTQRQLNAEKKKLSDGPLVESLEKRLAITHENITYLEELMRKIFTGWDIPITTHTYFSVQIDLCSTWKQPLAEMLGKAAYIRPKVVGPFPGPCASGSYVHRAALFIDLCSTY